MNKNKEILQTSGLSLRAAALVAGFGLLAMAILAGYTNFSVFQKMIVAGDANTTAENIIASAGLFRMGIFLFLVVAVLDVLVAWALYIFFKPVNKNLSLLAAWFRLVYAAIFAGALHNLLTGMKLFTGADYLNVFETPQLYAQGMVAMDAFQSGWDIGLLIFGLHLLVLGYLFFKSGYASGWWGIVLTLLLAAAGFGYLADSVGKIVLPNYGVSIAQFTFIGEVLLIFWLLLKGIKGVEKTSGPVKND